MDLVVAAKVSIEQFDVEKVAKDCENHHRSAIRASTSSAAKNDEQKKETKMIFKNYYCKIIISTKIKYSCGPVTYTRCQGNIWDH